MKHASIQVFIFKVSKNSTGIGYFVLKSSLFVSGIDFSVVMIVNYQQIWAN